MRVSLLCKIDVTKIWGLPREDTGKHELVGSLIPASGIRWHIQVPVFIPCVATLTTPTSSPFPGTHVWTVQQAARRSCGPGKAARCVPGRENPQVLKGPPKTSLPVPFFCYCKIWERRNPFGPLFPGVLPCQSPMSVSLSSPQNACVRRRTLRSPSSPHSLPCWLAGLLSGQT